MKSRDEYLSVLNYVPIPILIINPDTAIRYVNPYVEAITGFSIKELIGTKAPYPWWPKEAVEDIARDFGKAMSEGLDKFEAFFQKKNGERFWVQISSVCVKKRGEMEYFLTTWVDITGRKQQENALRESEQFSSSLLNYSPCSIMVVNPDTSIRYVNPSMEAMSGFSLKELVGRKTPYPWWQEEGQERRCQIFAKNMCKGTNKVENFQNRNGKEFWAEITSVAVESEGEFKYYLANLVDITESKKANERLKKLNDELRNLSAHLESMREQERERIAIEIHDELGQVLAALKWDIRWLQKRLHKNQTLLFEKTQAMSRMVDITVQAVRRICIELRPRLLDDIGLSAALEWLAQEFQEKTGIECKIVSEPEDINLDHGRSTTIFRIFQELLANVFRHARATRVVGRLRKSREEVVLKVVDNGIGATQEQLSNPKAFGLIGMRERARFFGGGITINSSKNKGTTVLLRIPVAGKENA